MTNSRFLSRETFWVSSLLAAAVLLFWWRVWIPSPADRMHFTDDIYVKDYPTRLGLYRTLLSGHWPFWDPYQFGGWPGLANCEAGFFYPFNLVLLPFVDAPQTAFLVTEWLVLFHLFLAGLGAYRLGRAIGLTPYGGVMAAVAFTFCGFHCAHKKHTNMIFTLVWLPWLLLQIEHWIRSRASRYLLRFSLLLAMAFFAGHPQSSLYLTLILLARLVYAAFTPPVASSSFSAFFKNCLPGGAAILLALALTFVQWLPTWELIRESQRSSADQFLRSAEFSLPPVELIDIVLPESLRGWSQVEIFYWGIAPLFLALLTAAKSVKIPLERFLIGVAILSVLFSLGEYLFVYDLSYIIIPGIAWVRAPSRCIYFAGLPIALLAGRGIDTLMANPAVLTERKDLDAFRRPVLTFTALFGLLLLLLFLTLDKREGRELIHAIMLLALFSGAFFFLLFRALQNKISPCSAAWLVVFLTWVDLGTHYHTLDLAPGPGGYVADDEVRWLRQSLWNYRTKVFFAGGGNRTEYHGSAQNFRELDGQSPLAPQLNSQLREDTALIIPTKPNLSLLRLCGINTLLTDAGPLPVEWKRETQHLYAVTTPSVRSRLLEDEFWAAPEVSRSLLTVQSFPYNRVALLGNPNLPGATPSLPFGALFLKPFLLVSGSAQSVTPFVHLVVDGQDHFSTLNPQPGYYFAVANPETGAIEETAGFNLMESLKFPDHPAHQRMLDFIRRIPEGKIVFAAVKDNATNVLLPEGLAALQAIGASVDVRGRYQFAHTIVGKKGAPIGSVLEILSPTEALVMQTHRAIYVEGAVAPKPQPRYYTTTDNPGDWYRLFTTISRQQMTPGRFATDAILASATPALGLPVPVTILSAPKKSFQAYADDRASILVGGEEKAKNAVGYNLVVLEPSTGRVVASECFDIGKDFNPATGRVTDASEENTRMRTFIRSVTAGYFVLGAIRDEATNLLQPETVQALRSVGSAIVIDPTVSENRYRLSHTFIGIKGTTYCVEASRKEWDAVVYTRYSGGPYLMPSDISEDTGKTKNMMAPVDPVAEIQVETSPRFPSASPGNIWSVEENGPNDLRISGLAPAAGILFTSEIAYPGWKATVDGVPRSWERVNYYFRGVRVSAGSHEVEFTYSPDSFWNGLWLSFAAVGAAFVWWILARRKPPPVQESVMR